MFFKKGQIKNLIIGGVVLSLFSHGTILLLLIQKKLTKNRFAIVADEIEVCVGERNGQTDRQAMTEKDKV